MAVPRLGHQSLGAFLGHSVCHRGHELASLSAVTLAGQKVDSLGRVNVFAL